MDNSRRDFILKSLSLTTLATISKDFSFAQNHKAPFFKISLSEFSLKESLRIGKLKHLEFPAKAAKDFDINAVDFGSQFFNGREHDASYISELVKRCRDVSVKPQVIIVDGGPLAGGDNIRKKSISHYQKWLDVAKELGCHSITVNDTGKGNEAQTEKAMIKSLTQLCELAQPLELNILVKNNNGFSSSPKWLSDVLMSMNKVNLGVYADFGKVKTKSGEQYDRYKNLEVLSHFAKAFCANSYDFDGNGEEANMEYFKIVQLINAALYKNYISILYEGKRLSEDEGILATKALLLKAADKIKS